LPSLVLPESPIDKSLVVVRGGVRSLPLPFTLSLHAPGIFTLDGSGKGPAAALHCDHRLVTPDNPARSGETIQLFAMGFSVRNPLWFRPNVLPVCGASAKVTFASS
jgi:uncharacterized protein (TIGR03437 family)